jgi:DNA-directed RNA polymerase subunit M/transcription elongation factor TFIIS
MLIIKKGTKEGTKFYAECYRCGAIIEAKEKELKNCYEKTTNCPQCGYRISFVEIEYANNNFKKDIK